MAFQPSNDDIELITLLGDYQVLTGRQLAALTERNQHALCRRLRLLAAEGLVLPIEQNVLRGRGRPELVFTPSSSGLKRLPAPESSPPATPRTPISPTQLHDLGHRLLLNWFRIHLVHMQRTLQGLTVRLEVEPGVALNPSEPGRDAGNPGKGRSVEDRPVDFEPDGAFAITETETGKSLLFFLEVDMGTEVLQSTKGSDKDIRRKIQNYRSFFTGRGYKEYEQSWGCAFNGFRLLFMANEPKRLTALCRFVQSMPASDFIWLTDQQAMFEQGVSANIWARGGRLDEPRESILGVRRAAAAPLPRIEKRPVQEV